VGDTGEKFTCGLQVYGWKRSTIRGAYEVEKCAKFDLYSIVVYYTQLMQEQNRRLQEQKRRPQEQKRRSQEQIFPGSPSS
jgi:hypothetical protein